MKHFNRIKRYLPEAWQAKDRRDRQRRERLQLAVAHIDETLEAVEENGSGDYDGWLLREEQ